MPTIIFYMIPVANTTAVDIDLVELRAALPPNLRRINNINVRVGTGETAEEDVDGGMFTMEVEVTAPDNATVVDNARFQEVRFGGSRFVLDLADPGGTYHPGAAAYFQQVDVNTLKLVVFRPLQGARASHYFRRHAP
ncbi:hypothetical protein [uncultured Paracoccus sp.]|uniref:hypothetical protein n=1 Tax=uncultured Paracoccus sp. TaxID=189685 RepID=UPI00262FBEA7|nr:hypothetical protein [uncultured Paracoccus sp.]